jgi:hypothetical protein
MLKTINLQTILYTQNNCGSVLLGDFLGFVRVSRRLRMRKQAIWTGGALALVCVVGITYIHQVRLRVAESIAKFETASRATNAIIGSTNVGVSYDQYSKLLQNLSTELLQLRDQRLSESEKRILGSYESVLEAFEDAGSVWQQEFNPSTIRARMYGTDLGFGADDIFSDLVSTVLDQYKIASSPYLFETHKVNATSAIRQIWLNAVIRSEFAKIDRKNSLTPKWLRWLDTHHLEWL